MNFQDPNRWHHLAQQLSALTPELLIALGMCGVLLATLVGKDRLRLPVTVAIVSLGGALLLALATLASPQGMQGSVLGGMFVIDPFGQFFKSLLLLTALVVLGLWLMLSRQQTHELDVPDYLCLLLGATLGMLMMTSAANLLMIFIAIESASLPSYVLAGFRKRNRMASEGSLKYVVFGSAASAVMLYGMSLIYGTTGSLQLSHIAIVIAADGVSPLLAAGMLAMLAGLAFKLSAVPMHFWTPDVFHGAPIEIATLLSIASKGAAVCLLARILQTLADANLGPSDHAFGIMTAIVLLGAATATWGNLVALTQVNIRRLLAYSSIAHAGYMIMACGVIIVADTQEGVNLRSLSGTILFYLLVYVFMNLGAFTIAGLIARQEDTQDIRHYAGLWKRSPGLAVLMLLFLLSLFGMPGLGGFMGKLFLATAFFNLGPVGYLLVGVLLFNTLLSFAYYLKPGYYMLVAQSPRPAVVQPYALSLPVWVILGVCSGMLLWTGILPGSLQRLTHDLGRIDTQVARVDIPGELPIEEREMQALIDPSFSQLRNLSHE